MYLFDGHTLVPSYPKPLTSLGLPPFLDHIDAAMVWGYNSKTYFFSGTMYWRFDDETGRVELDYPRDMSIWKGVSYDIDDAFQWKDGKSNILLFKKKMVTFFPKIYYWSNKNIDKFFSNSGRNTNKAL